MCRARPSRHLHQRRTVTGILQICWAREEMKLKDLRVFTGIHRCSPYKFGGTWCSPCKPCASLCSIQEYRNSDRREERNAAHCNRLGRLQESKGFKFCRCSKSIQIYPIRNVYKSHFSLLWFVLKRILKIFKVAYQRSAVAANAAGTAAAATGGAETGVGAGINVAAIETGDAVGTCLNPLCVDRVDQGMILIWTYWEIR